MRHRNVSRSDGIRWKAGQGVPLTLAFDEWLECGEDYFLNYLFSHDKLFFHTPPVPPRSF